MQAVELRSHYSPKRKISLNSLRRLTDRTALGMITGAKFYQHQHRMILNIDSPRKALMNTYAPIAATSFTTHHGNIGNQTGHFLQTCSLRSNTIK
jgi:hypothetical protein